jgi:hypothetical protein
MPEPTVPIEGCKEGWDMALEISRPTGGKDLEDEARRLAAERRAWRALEALLGHVTTDPTDPVDEAEDDEVVDIRDDAPVGASDGDWVSVAEAATRAGVSTSTVRQWYRSGRLATQRRDGERGGFLVPVADVVRLASKADEVGDVAEDSVIDINASYWATETEAARTAEAAARAEAEEARAESRRARADLEEARAQIETAREQLRTARLDTVAAQKATEEVEGEVAFLRAQLKEANDDLRELRARSSALEAQLDDARRAATFGSVASTQWVEEVDHGYRGPVRPQDPFGELDSDEIVAGPDPAPEPDEVEEVDDPLALLTLGMPPVVYGEAADDLLPEDGAKPKGRRGRR